jgi:HEAT repeat protein
VVAPLLEQAAREDKDEYIRFSAFVLLSGINEAAMNRLAVDALGDRNDRMRTVAYQWFEHNPRRDVLPRLLSALTTERSEFVRPALTRAIAAHGADPRARTALRPLVMRGEDMFRGSVITAIGDYDGGYALQDLIAVAKLEGPLQDDAVTALGKIGDGAARGVLAALQASGPRELQPTVSAALCLLGLDCAARLTYLKEALGFAAATDEYQPLLRGAVHALALLATDGPDVVKGPALEALFTAGGPAPETARAPIALGLASVALQSADVVLTVLDTRVDAVAAGELLRDGFDMLSEDFEEERFAIAVRRAFWAAAEGSARRQRAATLIDMLEF